MNLKKEHGLMISIFGVGLIVGSLVPLLGIVSLLGIVRLMSFAVGFGSIIGVICYLIYEDQKERVKNIHKLVGVLSPVIAVSSFIGIIDALTLIFWAIGSAVIVGGFFILAEH